MLIFIVSCLLLAGCTKFTESPEKKCFIPYVDFVTPHINPSTQEVTFTAVTSYNGTITSHKWDFGDGTTFNGATPPVHKYPPLPPNGSATYKVKYTVGNDCGEAFWTKEIMISGCLPDPGFIFRYVNDSTVEFTNQTKTPSTATYEWNFGDGETSTSGATTLNHVYKQDKSFTVTLKAKNSCGENSFASTVSVCKKPEAAQTVKVSECGAVTIDASGSKNGTRYQWNFGNGTTLPAAPSTSPTISYSYPNSGSYTIKLTVFNSAGCDSATVSNTVSVTTSPLGNNNNWSFTSDDLEFNFSRAAVTNASLYSWNFGDGTTSSLQNPGVKTYANPGSYTLTLTASNQCGVSYQFTAPLNVPFYKPLNNIPATGFQQVLVFSPSLIYYLGQNGKLYKTDTAGNWSAPINLPSGLAFNEDTRLYRDVNDNLWIYGKKEVARFNASSSTWTSFYSTTGFSNSATVNSMAVDNTGTLWTIGDGKLRKGTSNINAPVSFSSLAYAAGTGRIWLTSTTAANLYYVNINSTQVNSVSTSGVVVAGNDIEVASNGEIYLTSSTGIVRTNSSGTIVSNYNATNTGGFITGRPSDFDLDSQGNLWVLLSGQLHKVPVANSAGTKKYSINAELSNLLSLSVLQLSNTDTDILLAKNSGYAAIQIK